MLYQILKFIALMLFYFLFIYLFLAGHVKVVQAMYSYTAQKVRIFIFCKYLLLAKFYFQVWEKTLDIQKFLIKWADFAPNVKYPRLVG